MARSSGFKINKHLHDLYRISQITPTTDFDEVDWIFEVRAITNKFVPRPSIVNDLHEIAELESAADTQELASETMTDATEGSSDAPAQAANDDD